MIGFTNWSAKQSTAHVFELLETLFRKLDQMARKCNVFKVETIGDCYLAITGVPNKNEYHAENMADFALFVVHGLELVAQENPNLHLGGMKIRVV